MYVLEIRIQGSEKFSEILPQALRAAECMIEDIVSCSLLQIFDTVSVEAVTIRYIPMKRRTTTLSTNNA